MPYTMLKFDKCCWKYVVALNTSRGAERTTLITEIANNCGLNSQSYFQKGSSSIKRDEYSYSIDGVDEIFRYINKSKFYSMLCNILQKTVNNDINIRTYKVY